MSCSWKRHRKLSTCTIKVNYELNEPELGEIGVVARVSIPSEKDERRRDLVGLPGGVTMATWSFNLDEPRSAISFLFATLTLITSPFPLIALCFVGVTLCLVGITLCLVGFARVILSLWNCVSTRINIRPQSTWYWIRCWIRLNVGYSQAARNETWVAALAGF